MVKNCVICNKEIDVPKSLLQRKKYCSYKCRNKGLSIYNKSIGKEPPHIITSIIKNCLICSKEFRVAPNILSRGFGKYCSMKCAQDITLISQFKKAPWKFKGTKNEYRSLHKRINRKFGKSEICEHCGKARLKGKQIHWANISGNYLEDRNDWVRLCVKCHYIQGGRRSILKNRSHLEFDLSNSSNLLR